MLIRRERRCNINTTLREIQRNLCLCREILRFMTTKSSALWKAASEAGWRATRAAGLKSEDEAMIQPAVTHEPLSSTETGRGHEGQTSRARYRRASMSSLSLRGSCICVWIYSKTPLLHSCNMFYFKHNILIEQQFKVVWQCCRILQILQMVSSGAIVKVCCLRFWRIFLKLSVKVHLICVLVKHDRVFKTKWINKQSAE